MIDEYIYVDYENVQDIKVEFIKNTSKVIILIGNEQIKIPIDLVQKLQPMGNLVEWIRVNGKGRNALDFYISFFLGRDVTKDKNKHFVIYSKDTGYDPLITYLKNDGIKIRRIVSFQELRKDSEIKFDEAGINRIKDNLSKVASNKRPKKKTSLKGYIKSMLPKINDKDIDKIMEGLFIKKLIFEENGLIKYDLQKKT